MIQTIITCDVCKTEERGPYPKEVPGKYWKGEVAGGRWYKLSMFAAPAEGAAVSDVTIDVCPECAEKLADQLGMDELPPLVTEEEDDQLSGLTITTSPPFGFDPASDNTYTVTGVRPLCLAPSPSSALDSSVAPWPVDYTSA